MIIMGLDPGMSGGISIIETKKDKLPQIVYCLKMPIVNMEISSLYYNILICCFFEG